MSAAGKPSKPSAALAAGWIQFLGRYPWHLFLTLTYRNDATKPEKARKAVRVMVARCNDQLFGSRWYKRNQGLIWVLANETTKVGTLHHHMLLGGDRIEEINCKEIANMWFSLAGIAKVERIQNIRSVCRYVSKCCPRGEIELGGPIEAFQRRPFSSV